ncbi:MAG TPA: DNA-binding domain-containing protein [Spirochaetia bacterium]|nr:DNA-binding domain-containing protein [Spirochaetales bacterium]HRW24885.1 DNA-binding domain-containing protein [Spirochaetia bacterium]
MPLIVGLRDNTLVGRKESYRFHSRCSGSVDLEGLVELMAEGRTTVTKPDIRAVLELFGQTVAELAADGRSVKTPLGSFYVSAAGTADAPGARFTPRDEGSGHRLRLRFRPDRGYEARIAERATVRRDEVSWRLFPRPDNLSQADGSAKEAASPGDILRLKGAYLAFDRGDPRQGVFLTRADGSAAYRSTGYIEVRPRCIVFQLPLSIPPGDYGLAVTAATKAGVLRSGILQETVRVG